MKKYLACLVIVCFAVFVFGGLVSAATIGYIDVEKIFKEYKEAKKAQVQLDKEKESFEKELKEKQKQLEKAQEEGKTKEELEKMEKEIQDEMTPKRDRLIALNNSLTADIQKKVLSATEKVSKKIGIDTVVDKKVVIVGGMDLTDQLLSELNK